MKTSFLFLSLLLFSLVHGHSYVTSPVSRTNQVQTQSGCRGPACLGPCDGPISRATLAPIPVQRGASITVQWPRNNHAGGFIRFAWAPFDNSDSAAAFVPTNYQCHEVGGCYPDDPRSPNGGDSGPATGATRACSGTFTVPQWLTDGKWTLQWAWFGGAFALGDYYSCVDYQVSGGPFSATKPPAVFTGGDYSYPGQQKCKFFNTDEVGRCVNEPCNNPKFTLYQEQPGAAPFGVNALPQTGIPTSAPPTSAGTPTSAPVPTSAGVPTSANPPTMMTSGPAPYSAPPVGMCPNTNAPNINGDVLSPPKCGNQAPGARCGDGQCCSQFGFCGPIRDLDGQYRENGQVVTYQQALALYCNAQSQGDWRLVPCPGGSTAPKVGTSAISGASFVGPVTILFIAIAYLLF